MQKKFKVTVKSKSTNDTDKTYIIDKLPHLEMYRGEIHHNIGDEMFNINTYEIHIDIHQVMHDVFECRISPEDTLTVKNTGIGNKRLLLKQRKSSGRVTTNVIIISEQDIPRLTKKLLE